MIFGRQTWVGYILIGSVIVYELYCPEEARSQVVTWLGRVWTDGLTESRSQRSRIAVGYEALNNSVVVFV